MVCFQVFLGLSATANVTETDDMDSWERAFRGIENQNLYTGLLYTRYVTLQPRTA